MKTFAIFVSDRCIHGGKEHLEQAEGVNQAGEKEVKGHRGKHENRVIIIGKKRSHF